MEIPSCIYIFSLNIWVGEKVEVDPRELSLSEKSFFGGDFRQQCRLRCYFTITSGLFKRVKMRGERTGLVSVCLHTNCADISSKKRNQFAHKYFIRAIWRLWRASGSWELLNYCYRYLMCVLLLKMQSKSHKGPFWKQGFTVKQCIISNDDMNSLILYFFLCLQVHFVLIERGYTERQRTPDSSDSLICD